MISKPTATSLRDPSAFQFRSIGLCLTLESGSNAATPLPLALPFVYSVKRATATSTDQRRPLFCRTVASQPHTAFRQQHCGCLWWSVVRSGQLAINKGTERGEKKREMKGRKTRKRKKSENV
jgi:hypothetical protein